MGIMYVVFSAYFQRLLWRSKDKGKWNTGSWEGTAIAIWVTQVLVYMVCDQQVFLYLHNIMFLLSKYLTNKKFQDKRKLCGEMTTADIYTLCVTTWAQFSPQEPRRLGQEGVRGWWWLSSWCQEFLGTSPAPASGCSSCLPRQSPALFWERITCHNWGLKKDMLEKMCANHKWREDSWTPSFSSHYFAGLHVSEPDLRVAKRRQQWQHIEDTCPYGAQLCLRSAHL